MILLFLSLTAILKIVQIASFMELSAVQHVWHMTGIVGDD